MAREHADRVALVYRGDRSSRGSTVIGSPRLVPVGTALAAAGFAPEPAVYDDEWVDEFRDHLLGVRGALVWVDPVTDGQDRTRLDAVLREVAAAGVWVSAHPDTIAKIGTKEVLFQTSGLGWGSDTHLYASPAELEAGLPARLSGGGARVLKQNRGNGGIGIWKVELLASGQVLVQSARNRDENVQQLPLAEFISQLGKYFAYNDGQGRVIDQPFQPRITEGLIRCYLVSGSVVGFARQFPAGSSSSRVFGLPSAKTMYAPDEPALQKLRHHLEQEWVPGMQTLLDLDTSSLPALWDADFLLGAKDHTGEDTYVLIEINASCVTPFPKEAIPQLARAVERALHASTD